MDDAVKMNLECGYCGEELDIPKTTTRMEDGSVSLSFQADPHEHFDAHRAVCPGEI